MVRHHRNFVNPCYLFEYVSLHISSPHSFLNTTLSLSQTSHISSGPPKKKINLQFRHSTRLSYFYLGTHNRSALQKISDHIIPQFKNLYIPQNPRKSQQQSHAPHTMQNGKVINITFTGWIGQSYFFSFRAFFTVIRDLQESRKRGRSSL